MATNGGIIGKVNKASFGKCAVTSITATGAGTITTQAGTRQIQTLLVAGGGSGGRNMAGGGGAGGFREGKTPQCTYTQSPIACTSGSNNGIPVTAQGYPIVVGGGGAFAGSPLCTTPGVQGTPSSGFSLTATGGGGGGSGRWESYGGTGGSGIVIIRYAV